jgi:glyoxylase I family protein
MKTNGFNHIILTISDPARSQEFYGKLLGFELFAVADGFMFKVGDTSVFLFTSTRPEPNDMFSEFRIGLDHLAFAAPVEAALHELTEQLKGAGVETKGVETYFTGNQYVAFRDPDNIQLEYWLPK